MPVPNPQQQDYSYGQLERLWLDAGGPADQAPRAAATAEAESGGNPDAQYPGRTIAPGTGSWDVATGLWQILGRPDRGDFTAAELTDPLGNAEMAVAKYDEAGWQPWAGDQWARFYRGHVPPARSVPDVSPHPVPYANPFRDVQGLTPERVDMGVDYSGSGPVYALGPGVITEADNAWAGGVGDVGPGTFIVERLTAGPAAGHYAYVAENITPEVRPGQKVDTHTVIGQMTGQGAGIETGWAAGPSGGTTAAMAAGQAATGGDPGAWPTAYGDSYSKLLHSLGAPAGTMSGTPHGDLPSWLGWIKNIPIIGGVEKGASDTAQALGTIADAISRIEHGIEWFLIPSHWVRIFSGLFGTAFIGWGLWSMSRTGRAYSANVPVVGQIPVPEGGQIAPALGILSVTIGSVLLFVAFHNLPASVNDFGSFVSHLQQQAQSGGAGAAAKQPASLRG